MPDLAPPAVSLESKTPSSQLLLEVGRREEDVKHKNYKGFVAGVFSGIGKLSGELYDAYPNLKMTH